MNFIFDTKNELPKNSICLYNKQYEHTMNLKMEKVNNKHKIHYILLDMYERQAKRFDASYADASLYPVHVVIIPDRGKFTKTAEEFLQIFNLRLWEGIGWQKDERLAYQGWVNGYALKVITLEGLVAGIYLLLNPE